MSLSLPTRTLLILTSLNLLDYLDRYLIASLGSLVKAEMGLSDRAFGFLGTAFFLVYFLSSPIFGYLGDRYGRIRLMAGGAVLWSLATSLTYWVVSYPTLVLARGLVGVGEASFGTLAPAYLADHLPLNRRSRSLGKGAKWWHRLESLCYRPLPPSPNPVPTMPIPVSGPRRAISGVCPPCAG